MSTVYIASCVEDGGIYRCQLNDGKLKLLDKTPMDRPMYMTVSGDKLYVVLRAPFADSDDSGVITYDFLPDGSLHNPSEILSTKGQVACHILAKDGDTYCANYISGSVIKLPDTLVTHKGSGPNVVRQESAHVHYVGLTPDEEFVCAVDLGVDTIFLYDRNLKLCSKANTPAGQGPRHVVFSDDGKYLFCANELGSTVSAFSYNHGRLDLLDTVAALPENVCVENLPGAIRYRDGKLYVSNRGHDSVSVFRLKEKLMLEGTVSCGGHWPRDFDFAGRSMIIANEKSNSVCVRDLNSVTDIFPIPAPLCVAVL